MPAFERATLLLHMKMHDTTWTPSRELCRHQNKACGQVKPTFSTIAARTSQSLSFSLSSSCELCFGVPAERVSAHAKQTPSSALPAQQDSVARRQGQRIALAATTAVQARLYLSRALRCLWRARAQPAFQLRESEPGRRFRCRGLRGAVPRWH